MDIFYIFIKFFFIQNNITTYQQFYTQGIFLFLICFPFYLLINIWIYIHSSNNRVADYLWINTIKIYKSKAYDFYKRLVKPVLKNNHLWIKHKRCQFSLLSHILFCNYQQRYPQKLLYAKKRIREIDCHMAARKINANDWQLNQAVHRQQVRFVRHALPYLA